MTTHDPTTAARKPGGRPPSEVTAEQRRALKRLYARITQREVELARLQFDLAALAAEVAAAGGSHRAIAAALGIPKATATDLVRRGQQQDGQP